jgi:predicted enzyme related to lactoylglutathione lyase
VAQTSNHPNATGQITWSYVYELPSAVAFYSDVLGFKQVLDQGSCRIYRVTDDAYLGVCEARPRRIVEPRGTLITIVTEDVDGWYDRLVAASVKVDGP